jgi:hypothetical protein
MLASVAVAPFTDVVDEEVEPLPELEPQPAASIAIAAAAATPATPILRLRRNMSTPSLRRE